MDKDRFIKIVVDNSKTFMSLKVCNNCGSRMSYIQDNEHLAAFHPKLVTIVKKISEKVKSFPDIKQKYPSMDCRNLCAAKVIANRLIENLTKHDRSSLDLIQQLSEKITNSSDNYLISVNQIICKLCGLLFSSTKCTINHLSLRHPECLALTEFLRCRPLSELNFQNDVILLSKTKTQELIRQITNSSVLASCEPIVKLEKLPVHFYQECITKGYVKIKDNPTPLFNFQPSSSLNAISAEVMQKIRETVENSPFPDKNNITVVVVPKKILKRSPENFNSKTHVTSSKKFINNSILPTTSKIIRYGIEDLKRDRLMRQQHKEKITKKEEILKKMLSKYHEKETKKEVLYWQKKLTRYVTQHQTVLFKLENNLINARKLVTSQLCREKLLEELNLCVTNVKVKKVVAYLLKKLFDAMDKVPVIKKSPEKDLVEKATNDKLSSGKDSSIEEFDESILQVVHKNSIPNVKNKVIVEKNRQNLSSYLHLISEENIDEPPLQDILKHNSPEVVNDKVLVQKRTEEQVSSEEDSNSPEVVNDKVLAQKRTEEQLSLEEDSNSSEVVNDKNFVQKRTEEQLSSEEDSNSPEVVNDKVLVQKRTEEQLSSEEDSNSSEVVKVLVQGRTEEQLSSEDSFEKEINERILQFSKQNSVYKTMVPVQRSINISSNGHLTSKENNFKEDISELSVQAIPEYIASEAGNSKTLEQKSTKEKPISGNNSFKEVNEAMLQDVPNCSTFKARIKAPIRKRRLKMSAKPWTSEEDSFEDEFDIPRYSAPVLENHKVPVQKRKLISGKNSSKVDETILHNVPKHSTSNARNKTPVRKRRLKMSTLPWTSEEDSSEQDSSEEDFDRPIIPRYFDPGPEAYEVPVRRRKKRRVVLSSEADSSEEKVDAVLFKLLEKFYTFRPKKKVPVQESKKKLSSTLQSTSEKGNLNKNIDEPQKHSPSKVTKLVSVQRHTNKELSNLHLNSKKVHKLPPLQGFQKCSSPKVEIYKKLSITSFPTRKTTSALNSSSVCELESGIDPFVNTTLITDDKQFLECYCGKFNCDSLHPENFY